MEKTVRVLFINSVIDYGSTGKIIRSLMNGLIANGHETLAIYGRYDAQIESHTFSIANRKATLIHGVMSKFFGRHGLHSSAQTALVIEKIKEFNPDVIHLHNLHGYYINVPMLLDFLATDFKGNIVWTLHDAWLISGSSAYFDYHGCKLWDDGCVICASTNDYPISLGFKRQKKNFAWKKSKILALQRVTFISPSEWLKSLAEQSFLAQFPIKVVNNGIDQAVFKPTENETLAQKYQGKKVILGVASEWEARKGLKDFYRLKNLLDDSFIIVLIGLNNKQIQELPQDIVGIQRTTDAHELASYYTLAHAFINPTYEDNFPTTNLEAVSCGTPVIAYDTGGNKEVPFITIVEQGNVEAIAKTLLNEAMLVPMPVDLSETTFVSKMMKYYK